MFHEDYYQDGKLRSKTNAYGIPAIHATFSVTDTGKIKGKGGNGVCHQKFFDNRVLGTQVALGGKAKLTVEESGAIKGETNTAAQYKRWNKKGDVLNNEVVQGNAELNITPEGKGGIRQVESEQGE